MTSGKAWHFLPVGWHHTGLVDDTDSILQGAEVVSPLILLHQFPPLPGADLCSSSGGCHIKQATHSPAGQLFARRTRPAPTQRYAPWLRSVCLSSPSLLGSGSCTFRASLFLFGAYFLFLGQEPEFWVGQGSWGSGDRCWSSGDGLRSVMIAQLSLTVISKSILSEFKMGHVLCL